MKLVSVNVSKSESIEINVHGGEFQAVYSYPIEHYAHWQKVLGKTNLPYGTFGENFTVSGLLEDDVYVGDIFKVGTAVIQATMPRIPCFKLANKLGSAAIIKDFLWSGRSGFYHKVIEAGEVGAGDEIQLIEHDSQRISIRTILGLYKLKEGNAAALTHALSLKSLPPLLVEAFGQRLAKLTTEQ